MRWKYVRPPHEATMYGQSQNRSPGLPEMLVSWSEMPRSPRHVFYEKLQTVLIASDFDRFVEARCVTEYAAGGRQSLPPAAISACCSSASSKVSTASVAWNGAARTVCHYANACASTSASECRTTRG